MKPLNIGELLDAAFAAVRRNFGALVIATLVIVVPVAIIQTLISASITDHAFDFTTRTTVDDDSVGVAIAGGLASRLLGLVAQALAAAAVLRLVGGEIVGSPVSGGESLRFAAGKLGPLLWVTFLLILSLIVGFIMCLVGLFWLLILFSMATPALLFEDARGVAAMRRSRQLIEDNWWRVFGTLVVAFLLTTILQAVLIGLVGGVVLVHSDSQLVNGVVITVVEIVSFSFTVPFTAALLTYVYFDLRVRKEGFDLQLLARGIGADSSAPAPGAPAVEGLPASDAPPSTGFLPPRPPEPPGG